MDATESTSKARPGKPCALTANVLGQAVELRWDPPAPGAGVEPLTRHYVMRFRVEPKTGSRVISRTVFLGASARSYRDEDLPPGDYVYVVGGLCPEGSGPGAEVEVRIRR